jgi:hypothetical protein
MIPEVSPYELLKVLALGFFFGYIVAKRRHRRAKIYQFTNLRFGDLGENKGVKL